MTERTAFVPKMPQIKRENSSSQRRNTDFVPTQHLQVDSLLFLQRGVGNQAVQRLIKSGVIQPKLNIGRPNDIYEQDADRVAEQVMRMPEAAIQPEPTWASHTPPCGEDEIVQTKPVKITPLIQGQVEEEEELLQNKDGTGQTPEVTPDLESNINSFRSGGQPLPQSLRDFFEPRFGHDFSPVRLHTDSKAAEAAKSVNAMAFTVGENMVLGAGQFAPRSTSGKRLLAHELVHVMQQAGESIDHSSKTDKFIQRLSKQEEDPRIRELNQIAQEQVDSLWPSYKVLLQCLFTARKIGGLEQLVADLRARPHKVHGTYFVAVLRNIMSRGSEEILRSTVKMLAKEGIAVHETVEEYPLRFQIADYISGKIEETKSILIDEPKDSIWWVLKATLIDTFYTLEEGFVDVLRVGKGSEEAARAYAFQKDSVDRWAGIVKGLGEDFLRLTALYGPIEKNLLGATEKTAASELGYCIDDAVNPYVKQMETAVKKTLTSSESKSANIAKAAAEKGQKGTKSQLSKAAGKAEKIPAKVAPVVVTAEAAQAARSVLQKKVKDIKILNELWEEAGKAAKKTPLLDTSKHARNAFNLHRDRFWKAVRENAEAKKLFEDAGFVFGDELAPVYPGLPGRYGKISLDHKLKISTHPEHALDPDNLEVVIKGDNTLLYVLEKKMPEWPKGKLGPIGSPE